MTTIAATIATAVAMITVVAEVVAVAVALPAAGNPTPKTKYNNYIIVLHDGTVP